MIISPKDRLEAIQKTQRSGYFLVEELNTGGYRLSRSIGGKPIAFILEQPLGHAMGGFWIKPPAYIFKSKISFFDFCEDENRWTRNKQIITALLKLLRCSGIWRYIENKTFFEVNKNTTKATQKKAVDELARLRRRGL